MTAETNKVIMENIFERRSRGDGTALFERMSDDCRWIIIGDTSWSGSYDGKDTIMRDLITPLFARLGGRSRIVAESFFADGDAVIVEAHGENATTDGKRYHNQYCFVFRFSDGRIKEIKEYCDTALINQALGKRQVAPA